jgi:hypothetical protein
MTINTDSINIHVAGKAQGKYYIKCDSYSFQYSKRFHEENAPEFIPSFSVYYCPSIIQCRIVGVAGRITK